MSSPRAEYLYSLLPEIHRRTDQSRGFPLRALLAVMETEHERIEAAIGAMYDDWFVETCAPAMLPRIAGLTGFESRLAVGPEWEWLRAAVANSIACRRRKGTVLALERRIADLTGWAAQAVEDPALGPNRIELRVWRKTVYPITGGMPKQIEPGLYTFHPMGLDVPLYQIPEPCYPQAEPLHDHNLPLALTRTHLPESAVAILVQSEHDGILETHHYRSVPGDLHAWSQVERHAIPPRTAIVDPLLGRFALPSGAPTPGRLLVDYAYAFSGDLGGGPYPRPHTPPSDGSWVAYVAHDTAAHLPEGPRFATVAAALRAFRRTPGDGLIRILDSATYWLTESDLIGGPPDGCGTLPQGHRTLTLEAASGHAPCLHGELNVMGAPPGMRVNLRGLWIDGPLTAGGDLALYLEHCTLRPPTHREHRHDRHGIRSHHGDQSNLAVFLHRTICGPVRLPAHSAGIQASDCILDAHGAPILPAESTAHPHTHPPARLLRCTLLGEPPTLTTKDADCLVPRAGLTPLPVVSTRLGDPSYGQVSLDAGLAVLEGASNGSELGAFNFLLEPRRRLLLQSALHGYLPHGVQARTVFES